MLFVKAIKDFFRVFTKLIFKDRFSQIALGLAVVLNAIIWVLLYLNFYPLRNIGESVPLHYNIYFGIDLIGSWRRIFIMPTMGLFFIVVNFILADIIYLRDKVVSYFLLGAGAFIQIMFFLAAYMLVLINQ